MRIKLLLSLIVLVVMPALAQESRSLASVHSIHVGSMGQSDEAARFQLLLETELQKAGFDTVNDASKADAELTGVLTVRVYADESLARATVSLKTTDGHSIWGRDFEPHYKFGRTTDTVKIRAQDVAKSLRKDVEKAAKTSTNTKHS